VGRVEPPAWGTDRGADRIVVTVAFDQVQLLDVSGPLEVFTTANRYGARYDVRVVSSTSLDTLTSCGLRIGANAPVEQFARHVDTPLVPGRRDWRNATADGACAPSTPATQGAVHGTRGGGPAACAARRTAGGLMLGGDQVRGEGVRVERGRRGAHAFEPGSGHRRRPAAPRCPPRPGRNSRRGPAPACGASSGTKGRLTGRWRAASAIAGWLC